MTTTPIIQNLQTRFALDHENPAHVAVRAGLNRASWGSAKNLTAEQRETFRAIVRGESVEIKDVVAVVVAGLHASVTRWGQSMARRSGSQPLLDLYGLLPTTSGPVVDAHRSRVEQAQAGEVTRLRALVKDRGDEMLALQRVIREQARALEAARLSRPQAADRAAADFAYDLLTPEQRQRVSDFRTGYRAAQQS